MKNAAMEKPLVTIVMLCWNRKDEVKTSLEHIFEMDYPFFEVIVVDNNSTDGTAKMVMKEFPAARVVELNNNIGIAGWNEGFTVAKGEYILVLDDDSYPEKNSISIGVEVMHQNDKCGVVAMNVKENGTGALRQKDSKGALQLSFVGCGALIRSSLLKQIGGFESLLFLYSHELEFSMRVYNHGCTIAYEDNAIVIHNRSKVHRKFDASVGRDLRMHYHYIRNCIIILCLHFPLGRILPKLSRFIPGQIIFSCVRGGFMTTMSALLSTVRIAGEIRRRREVLSKETQRLYGYGNFFAGLFGDGVYALKRPDFLPTRIVSKKP